MYTGQGLYIITKARVRVMIQWHSEGAERAECPRLGGVANGVMTAKMGVITAKMGVTRGNLTSGIRTCTLYRMAADRTKWNQLVRYVVDTNGQ